MRRRPQRIRRRVGQRERCPVIRVLTEGRVTEREYLRLICGDSVRLQLGKSKTSPRQLVEQAKRDRKAAPGDRAVNRPFDEIWCIFVRDDHGSVDQAVQAAALSHIGTAVSNPCFELWLILHVRDQTEHLSASDAQGQSEELNLVDGKGLSKVSLQILKSSCQEAKQRALDLDTMHERNGSLRGSDPSSGVWRIADRLRDHSPS